MVKKLIALFVLIVFILFEFCGVYSYALTPYEGNVENPMLQEVTTDSITLVPIEGYEYSKDGMIWQDSNVFNNLTIGTTYEMYQRVKATDEIKKKKKSEVLEVTTKKNDNNEIPQNPSLSQRTDTRITLVSYQGYEYSIDGENFQDSSTFNNLTHNTEYSFCQRIKETSDTYASKISDSVSFFTLKKTNDIEPAEVQVEQITPTSIILVSIDGYEYSIDETNFQDNNVFDGLTPNTEYTIYQRMKETDEYESGSISNKTLKTIKYENTTSIDAPVLESYTAKDVILKKIDILEYSKDQENWQDSNIFTDLTPETDYTFYQRIKETNDTYASSISEGLNVKTKKENTNVPINPEIESIVENIVTLKNIDGYEYSADGGSTWQASNVLKLEPLTEYYIIQRIKSDNQYGYSINSESVFAKTEQVLTDSNIPDNYLPIYNEEDLNQINNSSQNYILMNDITFENIHEIDLYGTFEGNGYSIKENKGFTNNNNGCIRNLTIETNITITSDKSFGGIAKNNYGTIDSCINKGTITNKGVYSVAGIVYFNREQGTIKNCKNEAEIECTSGGPRIAGIASDNRGIIDNCINNGNITSEGHYIGGIVGENSVTITNCYNRGTIQSENGSYDIGGICGYNHASIESCYNMGNIKGGKRCGGIIGYNSGLTKNCYNSAIISCEDGNNYWNEIGGLIGYNTGILQTSYDLGLLKSDYTQGTGEEKNDYYLKQEDHFYIRSDLKGLTYLEMQNKESFEGFDFDNVWQIDSESDYYFPTLRGVENKAKLPQKVKTESIKNNSIELKNIEGYEYSLDGENYQDSSIFENLNPLTEYTIYQRIKNPETASESIVASLTVTTATYIGDINGDGKVNITDVALINAHVKKTKLLTGEELARADINGDGKVNITDVALVNAHVKKVKLLF